MSDTPLTDAVAAMEPQAEKINGRFIYMGQAHEVVSAEFARTLEKQLAERDAALARCVGGISKAIAFLDEHDAGSPTSGPSANGRAVAALMTLTQTKAAIPASIKATAKVLEAARQLGNALHEQNTTNAYDGTWSKGADRSVAVLSAEHSLIEAIREEKEGR